MFGLSLRSLRKSEKFPTVRASFLLILLFSLSELCFTTTNLWLILLSLLLTLVMALETLCQSFYEHKKKVLYVICDCGCLIQSKGQQMDVNRRKQFEERSKRPSVFSASDSMEE